MINYYAILEVANYASIAEVRKAYISKVKQYHPDLNPSPQGQETTKWLNVAWNALNTEEKKIEYDSKLSFSLQYKQPTRRTYTSPEPKTPGWRDLSVQERRRRMAEVKQMQEKEAFEKEDKVFPHKYRLTVYVSLLVLMIFMFATNYYIEADTFDAMIAGLSAIAYFVLALVVINKFYQMRYYESLSKPLKYNLDKKSGSLFWMLVLIVPVLVMGLNKLRAEVALKYFYTETVATIDWDLSGNSNVTFVYKANGRIYKKSVEFLNLWYYQDYNPLFSIKYANHDPRIVEVKELIVQNSSTEILD